MTIATRYNQTFHIIIIQKLIRFKKLIQKNSIYKTRKTPLNLIYGVI